jgi:hypothetical protein
LGDFRLGDFRLGDFRFDGILNISPPLAPPRVN